eukprot:gene18138-21681_t
MDNESLLQNSGLYLESSDMSSFIDNNEENYLYPDQCDNLLRDPQWNEKETMLLIELVGALGFNWEEVGKRLNKKGEDCHLRYDLVIKVFESKPRDINQSSSSSPIQSPSLNSSLPSPPEDYQSDDKFDGSRRRKSTTMLDPNVKKRHRRTASEIDRSFKCYLLSCNKSYGTEGALKMHIKLKHPGAKIPNSYLASPTLNGNQYFTSPRVITPYMSPHFAGMNGSASQTSAANVGGEGIPNFNAQATFLPMGNLQNFPPIPIYSKSPRAILPNTNTTTTQQPTTTSTQTTPSAAPANSTPLSTSSSEKTLNTSTSSTNTTQNNASTESTSNNQESSSSSMSTSTSAAALQATPTSAASPASPQVYKFSDLPSISLKIGSWEKASSFCGDLVARFSYTERKFMWEIFNTGSSLTKMEIFFDDINGMELIQLPDGRVEMTFSIKKQPLFYEAKFEANTAMMYKSCADFTGGEASKCKKHSLCFIKNALSNPLEALSATDPKFKQYIEASKINLNDCSPTTPSATTPQQQQVFIHPTSQKLPYLELEPSTSPTTSATVAVVNDASNQDVNSTTTFTLHIYRLYWFGPLARIARLYREQH